MLEEVLPNPAKDILYRNIGIGFIMLLALMLGGCVVGFIYTKDDSVHAIESRLSEELVITDTTRTSCNEATLTWADYLNSHRARTQVRNGSQSDLYIEVRAGLAKLPRTDAPTAALVHADSFTSGETATVELNISSYPLGIVGSVFGVDDVYNSIEVCATGL